MANPRSYCSHPNGLRKAVYHSAAKARRAARLLRGGSKPELAGLAWSPYRCRRCGAWHLTTLEQHDQKG